MIQPTSNFRDISSIMNIIVKLSPAIVLDVGSGSGKYGVLCKEYLGEIHPDFKIDAVEGYKEFVTDVYSVYRDVIIGDVRKVKIVKKYDLIMFIHILEHMSREQGRETLRGLLDRTDYIMVAVPRYFSLQHDDHEKGYQNHIYEFNLDDFRDICHVRMIKSPLSKIFILTKSRKKQLDRLIYVYYFKLLSFNIPFLVHLYRRLKRI